MSDIPRLCNCTLVHSSRQLTVRHLFLNMFGYVFSHNHVHKWSVNTVWSSVWSKAQKTNRILSKTKSYSALFYDMWIISYFSWCFQPHFYGGEWLILLLQWAIFTQVCCRFTPQCSRKSDGLHEREILSQVSERDMKNNFWGKLSEFK